MTGIETSDGGGSGLPRRAAHAAWRLLPLAGLVVIWALHLYYSVSLRPDILWQDDWVAFQIPGYSRAFDLANIFGTQNDTIAAYQNTLQYLMLVTTDLHLPSYIAVQNLLLLAFILAAWRLLSSIDLGLGSRSGLGAVMTALLLVPVFTGTHLFEGTGMRFNHNAPIVFLTLALLALRAPVLGAFRQPVVGCLLFLCAAAYVSGWMYLLAAALALALLRLLAVPEDRRADGLPGGRTMACAWIALLAVSALSIWLSHVPYELVESGDSHWKAPLVWPWDARFWIFYLITIARGWGLPATPVWGAVALAASLAPLLVLAVRLPRGARQDAAELFALAAPVAGALFALAMIAAGRGLFLGTDLPAVEAHARTNPKYLMHMIFILPFAAAAWIRAVTGTPWVRPAWRSPAAIAIAAAHLAGFALGVDGNLAERLDFRAIYGRSEAKLRDGGLCMENAVRLARATGPEVPVHCPGIYPWEMRALIQGAERAGVGSITAVTDKPPVAAARVSALIAEAEATRPAGRIHSIETGFGWVRVTGRAGTAEDGSAPTWIAVSVPGHPYWLARPTGGTGANPEAGMAGSFGTVVPTGKRLSPDEVRVWALYGLSGPAARAVPVGSRSGPLAALLDAPPAGIESRGGYIDQLHWNSTGHRLTVHGWALTDGNDDGRRLRFLAPGAVSVLRVEVRERPDVVAAHGNDGRLLRSGFTVVLKFPSGAGEPPCLRVWSEDRAFGRRALTGLPDRDPAACAR